MPHRHFLELRTAIHKRLRVLRPPAWEEQIEKYPWLYGALGDPGAKRMFICENPSLGALQRIRESRLGGPPDFDTQWTGDPAKSHDERFRKVLCGLGLKDGEIWERGGWSCYITNVIKQAAFVRDWNEATRREKKPTVGEWSEILQMEIDAVRPDVVFCVGGEAHWMVKWLRGNSGLRIPGRVHGIWHYSARQSDEVVERKMRDGIEPYL
ncbi:MAG: uracil-DNA glycosylase family protein [Gemmatimonadetes bacterium]|nr:uracil-DNA glycosylase family protein [Gemmatimonadota bacterium]